MSTVLLGIFVSKYASSRVSEAYYSISYTLLSAFTIYVSFKFPIGNEENEPHLSTEFKKKRIDLRTTFQWAHFIFFLSFNVFIIVFSQYWRLLIIAISIVY